jgi:hypothetical protein
MSDALDDPGILGRAEPRRVDELERLTIELTSLVDACTPTDAMQFSLGVLDTLCGVACILIGLGVVEASVFEAIVETHARQSRACGNAPRALATEMALDRLRRMAITKGKADAHLVLQDNPRLN